MHFIFKLFYRKVSWFFSEQIYICVHRKSKEKQQSYEDLEIHFKTFL